MHYTCIIAALYLHYSCVGIYWILLESDGICVTATAWGTPVRALRWILKIMWNSLKIDETQRSSAKLNEAHWSLMTLNDIQCKIIEYVYVLDSVSSTMNPQNYVKLNENQWNSAKLNEAHWSSKTLNDTQWQIIEYVYVLDSASSTMNSSKLCLCFGQCELYDESLKLCET